MITACCWLSRILRTRVFHRELFGAGIYGITLLLWSAGGEAAGSILEKMEYAALPGDKVRVALKFSSAPPNPQVFTIDDPPRIALDFPGSDLKLTERFVEANVGPVRSVAAAQANARTRVVVNLLRPTAYHARAEGNELVLTIGGDPTRNEVTAPPPRQAPTTTTTAARLAPPATAAARPA